MTPRTELRDGINHALPPTRYKLSMKHPAAQAPTFAWSENFDKLNELRKQLERMDYALIGISS